MDIVNSVDWEVIVVGAGPAGSSTAALLAQRGHSVLLLDRAIFPRRKPCGESINPGAVRELATLGVLPRILALPHQHVSGWRIHPKCSTPFVGAFPSGAFGLGIDRALFDDALVQNAREAGAEIGMGKHVVDLVRDEAGVHGVVLSGGERLSSSIVVGADGLRSIVVRKLGFLRRTPRLRKLALTAHATGVSFEADVGQMHLQDDGCVGAVTIGPGVANVVMVTSAPRPELGKCREVYFDRIMHSVKEMATAERTTSILATGPFDWPTRLVATDGALLVGDAAGYFDPFTGQGIHAALYGARLAAGSIAAALDSGDHSASAFASYERRHRQAFRPGRRLQHVIETVTHCHSAMKTAATVLRARPTLADRLLAVTGDLHPVHTLLLPTRRPV